MARCQYTVGEIVGLICFYNQCGSISATETHPVRCWDVKQQPANQSTEADVTTDQTNPLCAGSLHANLQPHSQTSGSDHDNSRGNAFQSRGHCCTHTPLCWLTCAVVVCWLLNVPATGYCISGAGSAQTVVCAAILR